MADVSDKLRRSWNKLLCHYPYFLKNSELGELYEDVGEFAKNFSLHFNSFGKCSVRDFVGSGKKHRLFAISLALVIMSYLQSQADTWDDRMKISAKTSRVLWNEWGEKYFTYYTGAEFRFDEHGHLDVYGNNLIRLLYGKFVEEHSTIRQKQAGSIYRYLYEEVDSFKKVVDCLVLNGELTDCEFRFPLI